MILHQHKQQIHGIDVPLCCIIFTRAFHIMATGFGKRLAGLMHTATYTCARYR